MCTCARCGELLTAPTFHQGKPYGYTCYEVVTGLKAKKSKEKWIEVDTTGLDTAMQKAIIEHRQGVINFTVTANDNKRYRLSISINSQQTEYFSFSVGFKCKVGSIKGYLQTVSRRGKRILK